MLEGGNRFMGSYVRGQGDGLEFLDGIACLMLVSGRSAFCHFLGKYIRGRSDVISPSFHSRSLFTLQKTARNVFVDSWYHTRLMIYIVCDLQHHNSQFSNKPKQLTTHSRSLTHSTTQQPQVEFPLTLTRTSKWTQQRIQCHA